MSSASPWLINGHIVSGDAACLSPWDRGFRFGDGVYETLRVHRGKVIRRAEHLHRMAEGLAILELELDPDSAFPAGALAELVAAAGLAAGEGRMRLYVTRGIDQGTARPPSAPRPTRLATVEPLPAGAAPSDTRPISLAVVEAAFPRPAAWGGLKSLNHLPYVLAAAKAARAGADEALLVYEERVKETTAANVFVVESGVLATPPLSEGVLAGVTRDLVLELARSQGFIVAERPISRAELVRAEEIFVSGSVAGIRSVAAVHGHVTLGEAPGRVTVALRAAYAAVLAAEAARR
jgi:branched-subunit amino acid aminotransferase/4-amino-4-deoxychorismate lyase